MAVTYFEELKGSLEEAIAHERGESSRCRVDVLAMPTPKYTAQDVAAIRKRAGLSQRALAAALGVSPRTVEAWEAGKNAPSGAASKLLYLIEKDHEILGRLIQVV